MSLTGQREGIEAGRLDRFADGAFAAIRAPRLVGPVVHRFNRRCAVA
jgi:hypothetical protein